MPVGVINIKDLAQWPQKVVDKYHGVILEATHQTLQIEGMQAVQASIDATTPHPPVSTGGYRRQWRVYHLPNGSRIANSTKIAPIIEDGRRPGKGVSQEGKEAIARWVHLHGMDTVTMRDRANSAERSRTRALTRLNVDEGYVAVVKNGILQAQEKRFTDKQRKALRTARALGGVALKMAKTGQRQRFIDAREKKAMSIAFLIARAIKRRGLPAKQVLGRATKQIVDVVMRNVHYAMGRTPPT